ncbi:MAG: DNA polymerase III subunit delta' [Rudaea sp.]
MTLAPWLDAAWQQLGERRERGMLPHALLICGPPGLGKRDFAEAFANALLCEKSSGAQLACGTCRACLLIAAGSHPDRVKVGLELRDDGKPRTELTVDQIRHLSQRLALTAQFGGMQVATIDPADAMNQSASNALLKTLEEPTPATVIMLVADQPARLSATIRSRCQRVDIHVPTATVAAQWLRDQGVSEKTVDAALQAGSGNPGLALRWSKDGGLAMRNEVTADLRALFSGKNSPVDVANRWAKNDPDGRLWFAAGLLRDEAQASARGASGPLALTSRRDLTKLARWFDQTNRARAQLRGPLRPELVVLDALSGLNESRSA